MLNVIHRIHVNGESNFKAQDITCNPPCLAHRVFNLSSLEQWRCRGCASTSDPIINNEYTYRVYLDEVKEYMKSMTSDGPLSPGTFNLMKVLKDIVSVILVKLILCIQKKRLIF